MVIIFRPSSTLYSFQRFDGETTSRFQRLCSAFHLKVYEKNLKYSLYSTGWYTCIEYINLSCVYIAGIYIYYYYSIYIFGIYIIYSISQTYLQRSGGGSLLRTTTALLRNVFLNTKRQDSPTNLSSNSNFSRSAWISKPSGRKKTPGFLDTFHESFHLPKVRADFLLENILFTSTHNLFVSLFSPPVR